MKTLTTTLCFVITLGCVCISASAAPDVNFMQKAAEAGMTEVILGNYATAHAADQSVKDFGARMVTDHTKLGKQLMTLAARQGVTLPSSPSSQQRTEIIHLESLSGRQFDRKYIAAMVKDHTQVSSLFSKEAHHGHNADDRALANQGLPVINMHLSMAKHLNQRMASSSR